MGEIGKLIVEVVVIRDMEGVADIPLRAICEATGFLVKVETTDGSVYDGKLMQLDAICGDIELIDVRCQHRDSSLSVEGRVFLKGSSVRLVHLPSDLKRAPFLDWRNLSIQKQLKSSLKASKGGENKWPKRTRTKPTKLEHRKKKLLL